MLDRGTFMMMLKEEPAHNGNILRGRFVFAIKSTDDRKVKYKARYVIGSHRNKFKGLMVHSTSTLQLQSVRLLLALASAFGFNIWTSDVAKLFCKWSSRLVEKF